VSPKDAKERRIAWILLIVCPLLIMIEFVYVTLGYAHGLDAGHPMEYLQVTCILWAAVSAVLPALRLLKIIAMPLWFILLVYGNMWLFIASLCQGMYFEMLWWPNFTHVISAVVVTAIVFMALCLMKAHSPPHVTFGTKGGMVAMTIMVGLSFGAVWEIMEGFTDIISQYDYMSYGAVHSLGNLTADMIGTFLMGGIALIILSKYGEEHVASSIRLGKKNIDVK
jgi:hypothetical protein